MNYQQVEIAGTLFFAIAVLHTFFVKFFHKLSLKWPKDSLIHAFLHLMSEVEVVFGFWATLFFVYFAINVKLGHAVQYVESLHFVEPIFIFVIMIISSTLPILRLAEKSIEWISHGISKITQIETVYTDYLTLLCVGTLAGSFITEPAAMTVTALLLKDYLSKAQSRLLYGTLAFLFVNISVGGALTHFAAPPILMVTGPWGWDLKYVFMNLGEKSIAVVIINSIIATIWFRRSLKAECTPLAKHLSRAERIKMPSPIIWVHLLFLAGVILSSHYVNTLMGIFLLFIGFTMISKPYQAPLKVKESLLVAFFLAGIMMFGPLQSWWLSPLLTKLSDFKLYMLATVLTSFTDNAALTYLGTQVTNLSETSRLALVEGALVGGGLTIIANAPNAAGFAILSSKFGGVLNPVTLLKYALLPTSVAFSIFWIWTLV